ncbi:unnamed protein product [Rhizophagus irregularis]|nr:unnamed protein product [Rhizophagus irregularis]
MERCWDPNPANRPTAYELSLQIGRWMIFMCKYELDDSQLAMRQKIEKEFSQERKNKWKAQLAELAINPCPLKRSQNMLTSKQLDYSKQLTQLLEVKDDDSTLYIYEFWQIKYVI